MLNHTTLETGVSKPLTCRRMPTPLLMPKQVYLLEQAWFDTDNVSYGLMQQAAWQIAKWVEQYAFGLKLHSETFDFDYTQHICIWVGAGNNGGDGWLVASYLSQLAFKVTVIEVGAAKTHDARLAKNEAKAHKDINIVSFTQVEANTYDAFSYIDIFIDGLFGIGLDRQPTGDYAKVIHSLNSDKNAVKIPVIAIDVPSGLLASTGHVYEDCAVKADVTLCLIARKVGLHIKDGPDYTGEIVDIALLPTVLTATPTVTLQYAAEPIPKRKHNAHKGSFGEVLIVGGNQVAHSQGMGGASILAASSAFAVGTGKLTVACHKAFHSSLITHLPHAMSIDLLDKNGVIALIQQCDVMAIGMGLGRDELSLHLFYEYLQAGLTAKVNMVIDADGLYHLATLSTQYPSLRDELNIHSQHHDIFYTPHSGEAARLLDLKVSEIENNRLDAIQELSDRYQGSWLLKGNGSLIIKGQTITVCAAGNAGMSTAGMGDVLSGIGAGLLAQSVLPKQCRTLQQAVMIHAMAGDKIAGHAGEWALQANDMAYAVGQVMQDITL